MANEVMAGLFGVTPESLAAQREQALQKQALTFAQLDPAAQAQYQLFLGGNRLGGAIGGMLGAQDPELARVAQRQQLLQGVNPSDAASLREAASRALAARDTQAAAMLGQRAMDVEMEGAKLESEKALAKQRGKERDAADPTAQFIRSNADKFTPQTLQLFSKSGNYAELVPVTKPDNIKNYQTQVVGVAAGTNEPVYALTAPGEPPKQVVYKMVNGEQVAVPYTGGVDRSTAKTTVNVPLADVFDKAFSTQNAKEQSTNWDLAGQAYATIPSNLKKLGEVRDLIDSSFTGKGADVKLGAAKFARAIGLPIDVTKASNTEITEALTTQFAIAELKKNFGSNPAVKDFEAQLKVKPNILQEPETFKRLVNNLITGLQAEEIAYRKGNDYMKNNKGSISGFNPYIARAEATTKLNRLTTLQSKALNGTITEPERREAQQLQQELK